MRGHSWEIKRQLFTLFVLLEFFLLITTVSSGVIKREAIANTTVTVTEIATEEITTPNIITSTEHSSVESSTPLTIVRVTADDIKKQQEKRLAESTIDTESLNENTTVSLGEILKVGIGKNQTTKLIRADVISTENPIEKSVTASVTDVPTTEDVLNISRTTESDQITTEKVITDETTLGNERGTTTEEVYLDYIRYTHDNNDSLPENTENPHQLENLQFTTIDYKRELDLTTFPTTHDSQTTSHKQDDTETSTILDQKDNFEATTVQIDPTTTDNSEYQEGNITILVNTTPTESTNYNIIPNEIKNVTTSNPIKPGEKQSKQLKNSNMTLPDSPEVWALAGLKNVENTKDIDGKLINATLEENNLPETTGTTPAKLITDWTKIMKEVELNNSIRISPNSIENSVESNNDRLEEPKQKLREQLEQGKKISPSPTNYTTTTTSPMLSNSSSISKEEIVKPTPPIERNQVEDVERDLINKKKIKVKDNERNNSIREEHNEVPLFTATEIIIPEKLNATSAKPFNVLAKMVQEPMSTSSPSLSVTTPVPHATEVRQIINIFTTTNPFENLVDTPNLTISSDHVNRNVPTLLTTTQRNIDLTTTSGNHPVQTSTKQNKTTITSGGTEAHLNLEVTSIKSMDSSTQTEVSVESSSGVPYSPTFEMSTTEFYEQYSSSTLEIPSSTIITQIKPGVIPDFSTTTTEEYSRSTTSVEDTFTTKIGVSASAEQTTVNNVIEKLTDSTTAGLDQFTSETSRMSTTTFISLPEKYETLPGLMNTTDDISTTTIFQNTPTKPTHHFPEPTRSQIIPKVVEISTTEQSLPIITTQEPPVEGMMPPENNSLPNDTDYNVIIAISVSVVGIIALILLVGFLYVMRKRQKNLTYGQRCRPVSLDAYSLDNVSIYNSVRRKGAMRASKRSYGNVAFDDPSLKHNVLNVHDLSKFVDKKSTIHEEFKDVPQIIARPDEVPQGCEDKNRYANVIPLPETRVILQKLNDDEKTDYINANYVRGPKDPPNYYIACQAPLESTVADFWRMIWEQNSRVIIMATDLVENGKERCAEYLPPSITIDNHVVYGDFQITLKNREVKEKYAVSTLHVKNTSANTWREITHFWYQWPETGVPDDEAGVIAMLLEARSCLKIAIQEQADEDDSKSNGNFPETNGNTDKSKSVSKAQGPLTVHCSPGTGRTGTIIACDIALRSLETPKRSVDIPQIVYYVRRGRASAVQTKEQYEFIYRVAHMYATKISGPINET